jgi:hypothetical protein
MTIHALLTLTTTPGGLDTHLSERLNGNVETVYCHGCRENCAICGDWIAGRPEMNNHEGRRIHVACEVAAILEVFTEVTP